MNIISNLINQFTLWALQNADIKMDIIFEVLKKTASISRRK